MSTAASADQKKAFDTLAVNNFREYLRIPSVHPNVNYDECLKFLKAQAISLDLPITTYYCVPNKPIVIITWTGTEPQLSSILLNSHMDVVPVFEKQWTHKPFDADVDEQGKIFARGTQDMKSVGIQYIEAIRRLKMKNVTFRRTIHMCFVPDEETGGEDGMRKFVDTQNFRSLNIGFSLDEGMASPTDDFVLFYGERCIWHIHITCNGQPGHGSLLLDNTAGEKMHYIINKFMEFRKEQKKRLKENSSLTIGDVTSVNITQVEGGVQSNVIPAQLKIVFDVRIPVTVDIKKWEETINRWCQEAGDGITIEYEQKQMQVAPTVIDNSNSFWVAFKEATTELNLSLKPQIFPGGTDSRYIRGVGLPAIGFSPINNTPVLLHDNDEYLKVDVFLKGIDIYCKIIPSLANVPDCTG